VIQIGKLRPERQKSEVGRGEEERPRVEEGAAVRRRRHG